jgi:hypothetical protein
MSLPIRSARPWLSAAAFAALAFLVTPSTAVEPAPSPRQAGTTTAPALKPEVAPAAKPEIKTAVDLDKAIIAEIKARSEIMKNLQYLSDVIGPRLTGSKNLERANNWTADKMKSYGLVNVRLEPWEIPIGWERGKASMKIIDPDNGRDLIVCSAGWSPGTKGKVTGDVVIIKGRTKADLEKYKGKLKGAVILMNAPANVAPVTDLRYGAGAPRPKKDADPKKDEEPKKEIKNDECGPLDEEQPPKKDEQPPKKDGQPQPKGGFGGGGFGIDTEFLKAEGVACTVSDAGKPHGLLVTTGGWGRGDRGAQDGLPRLYMAHEHYALLYRLASREGATTRVETEIENKFIPGPVTVYNTVGEIRGTEKPDEFVVLGAHLDSWDLAQGTTDNGTGSSVVLETARTLAAMAKQGHGPKRTVRFVLFTGEEQGLHGSRKYVERHKATLDKHSVALVHDTGTGKVLALGTQGRKETLAALEPELVTLKEVDGWTGLNTRSTGGTDHLPFNSAGVPGFACQQETDEYRLTHHTQSDTFDKAKEPNLIQGAQVLSVTAMRIANMPELLPRK